MRSRLAQLPGALTPLQSLIARHRSAQWTCHACKQRKVQRRALASATTAITDGLQKPFYATTPIFYVNAAPHVGHMYTLLLTDIITRWQRLKKCRAILCTGTDEHGIKVQQAAAKARIDPQRFCDKGADVFKDLAASIDISNDIFIRTTDEKHKEAVRYAWQILEQNRYLYESKHQGWYSVSDETFYPQAQVQLIVDPPTGRKIMASVETGKEVEWTREMNYHFRLSMFRERLLDFYDKNPHFIVPRVKMDEVVKEVQSGLEDLSISRPVDRLNWGIRVPNDPGQTMYVWVDALLNYATAVGYPFTPGSAATTGWPPDVQVIGKDIVRFHCIYWPALLMALDLPLPKQILVHSHWTLGRQKMSKSTGNGVNPFFALERFGLDTMRWYLIHEGGIADDADYDNSFVIERYKKHLQDGLGNLTSRIVRFKGFHVGRAVERFSSKPYQPHGQASKILHGQLQNFPRQVDGHMRDLLPNRALQAIMRIVGSANTHIQQSSPWQLARRLRDLENAEQTQLRNDDTVLALQEELDRLVYLDAEALRLIGIMLQPFIPDAASRLLDMLGVQYERRTWEWCAFGTDHRYGKPLVEVEKGEQGLLFPGLTSAF